MQNSINKSPPIGIISDSGVDNHIAIGDIREIVINLQLTTSELLAQHLLTRVAQRHLVFLVQEKVKACGRVDIIGQLHRVLNRGRVIAPTLLGQEIISQLGIRVENTREMRQRAVVAESIVNGSAAIETDLVVLAQDRYTFQIISNIRTKHLADAVSTITIHFDIGGIGESHLGQLVIGDFIHAALGDSDFHPLASSKLRRSRIIAGIVG